MRTFNLLRIVWRGRLLILLSTVIGVGTSYLYLRTLKPIYTSTARLLVEPPYVPASEPHPRGNGFADLLRRQAALLTSPQIVRQALADPNVLILASHVDCNRRLLDVIRSLSATVGRRDDIISISASSEDPNEAAVIVNAVVRAYIRWHEARRQDGTADWMTRHSSLEIIREALMKTREERKVLEQRNPEMVERARGGATSGTLDLLRGELITARLRVLQQKLYCARLKGLESDPNRFCDFVRSQERSVDRRIVESDRDLFVRRHIALAETLCEDAKSRVQKLTKSYEEESAKLQDADAAAAQYELLTAEHQMLEDQYNHLMDKLNRSDPDAQFVRIHVLEWATPGVTPSSQNRIILSMGFAFGLIMGIGLSLIREWTRDERVASGIRN